MEDESGKDVNVWNYLSSVFSRNCLFKKLFKKVSIQETVKKKKKERNYHYTILHILCVCEYQTGFYEFP